MWTSLWSQVFLPIFLSLDLEVGKQDHRIHSFAAVRPDVKQPLVFHGGDLAAALAKLDAFADGADFLLGHNLIAFDLPHLKAAKPNLRMLKPTASRYIVAQPPRLSS